MFVRLLSKESSFKSLEEAKDTLLNSKDPDLRHEAVHALGKSCLVEAIPPLLQALQIDSTWYVRALCAGYVGCLRGVGCKEALLKALNDSDASVRERAVKGLAKYNETECEDAIERLRADSSEDVRGEVDRVLKTRSFEITSQCPYFFKHWFCDSPVIPDLCKCSWNTSISSDMKDYHDCAVYREVGSRKRPLTPEEQSRLEERERRERDEEERKRQEQEKRREEEAARKQAEEQLRAKIQAQRKGASQCVMCGRPLNFLQKLLGKERHGGCSSFVDVPGQGINSSVSGDSWECNSCGELNPADVKTCIHCRDD